MMDGFSIEISPRVVYVPALTKIGSRNSQKISREEGAVNLRPEYVGLRVLCTT